MDEVVKIENLTKSNDSNLTPREIMESEWEVANIAQMNNICKSLKNLVRQGKNNERMLREFKSDIAYSLSSVANAISQPPRLCLVNGVKYLFNEWIVINSSLFAILEDDNGKVDCLPSQQIKFLDNILLMRKNEMELAKEKMWDISQKINGQNNKNNKE